MKNEQSRVTIEEVWRKWKNENFGLLGIYRIGS